MVLQLDEHIDLSIAGDRYCYPVLVLPAILLASSGTVNLSAFYPILKLFGLDSGIVAPSLISSLFLVSFVLLSLGFLTEPVDLSLPMVGICFMIRWMKGANSRAAYFILNPLIAALGFAAAQGTREPYL